MEMSQLSHSERYALRLGCEGRRESSKGTLRSGRKRLMVAFINLSASVDFFQPKCFAPVLLTAPDVHATATLVNKRSWEREKEGFSFWQMASLIRLEIFHARDFRLSRCCDLFIFRARPEREFFLQRAAIKFARIDKHFAPRICRQAKLSVSEIVCNMRVGPCRERLRCGKTRAALSKLQKLCGMACTVRALHLFDVWWCFLLVSF